MLDTIFRQEMMLDSKLKTAANVPTLAGPIGPPGPTGAAGAVTSVNGQAGAVVLNAKDGVFPINNGEPSGSNLNQFNQPGVYSSNDPFGPDPLNGPPALYPPVWTLYVSRVGDFVQQLYISNSSLYYRSSQDGGLTYTLWTPIGEQGPTGPTRAGATGAIGATGIMGTTRVSGIIGATGAVSTARNLTV